MLKDRINADLKAALLAGDKATATTLRGIKSTILYAEVANDARDVGLSDDAIIQLLSKEAKKRQESIDLYQRAGDEDRASAEMAEKSIIEAYLPEQLSPEQLAELIDQAMAQYDDPTMRDMGAIIAKVKASAGPSADGALIAEVVKERLQT
jgi:uncharacterized protein